MHKAESNLKNKTDKVFWYFKIQTVHLISIRRLDLALFVYLGFLFVC